MSKTQNAAYYRAYRARKAQSKRNPAIGLQTDCTKQAETTAEQRVIEKADCKTDCENGEEKPVIASAIKPIVREDCAGLQKQAYRPPPCSAAQWETFRAAMVSGSPPLRACESAGITWSEAESYGVTLAAPDEWQSVQKTNKQAVLNRLQARAVQAVEGTIPTRQTETTNSRGEQTTSEERRVDPALIAQAAALTDVETFGRQSKGGGDTGPSITIQLVAQTALIAPKYSETVL